MQIYDAYWYCIECTRMQPFSSLNDEEFFVTNSMLNVTGNDVHNLEMCNNFKFDTFDELSGQNHVFDICSSIDPDKNFYQEIKNSCKYLTQENFITSVGRKNGLSLIHVNCRSIRSSFDNLKSFLEKLSFRFDFIAVSESWLSDNDDIENYRLENYDSVCVNRKNKRNGGVIIYVSTLLKYKRVEKLCLVKDDLFECAAIEVEIPHGKNVTVMCVYRSPGSNIQLFTTELINILTTIKQKNLILSGDFNINLLNSNSCQGTKEFIDCIYRFGLFPLINKPTRVTLESATLIDNIFTNLYNDGRSGILVTDEISDHFPVFSQLEYEGVSDVTVKPVFKVTRRVDDTKIYAITAELDEYNWHNVFTSKSADSAYESFVDHLRSVYDKYCPLKKVRCKDNMVSKPWLTKGILKSCRRKNKLYYQFVANRSQENESKYKSYKNRLVKLIKYSKKAYFRNLLLQHKHDTKETWCVLKKVLNKPKSSSQVPDYFVDDQNCKITDCNLVANKFNEFFVNIGPKLASKITDDTSGKSFESYIGELNQSSIFLSPTTELEVLDIVKHMKCKTSNDYNNFDMQFVKKIISSVIKPLVHICNLSLSSGVFPDDMKIAKVIPLFKAGDKCFFTNYRPISLLPQFSKVLEKLFSVRLLKFIDKCDILSECQYGFRSNRSTSLALNELIEQLTYAIDNKKVSIGVFIDLKKAFDTINHSILLKKLEHYGIRGIALKWLTSYLCNRRQFVKYNGCESEMLNITCGVPQGSILGPILFIIYINDICNVSNILKMILFADDTNAFCSGRDIVELVEVVNNELDKLNSWFRLNKLSLNVSKTNYVVFTNKRIPDYLPIKIDNKCVSRVYSTKFLGVIIDSKLNWKEHIGYVISKLLKSVSVICKAADVLDKFSLKLLYYSLFFPYINYCSEVWGTAYKTSLIPIVTLQKRILRIICKVQRLDHTAGLFKSNAILPLHDLVHYKIAVLMYKAVHKLLPIALQARLHVFEVSKRNNRTFKEAYCRTNLKGQCISITGPKFFNTLPCIVQKACSVNQFMGKMKSFLFEQMV